jgi:stage V sporulation protein S
MSQLLLRVKGSSNPISLASVIAHGVYENKEISLRAIGPGPVNQAVKAVAIAQSYTGAKGIRLLIIPGFADVEVEGKKVTAILLKIRTE